MYIYICLATPHPSDASHRFHSFLEVFGDKMNIPEDTRGRQVLLADTGRVPAAPSRSSWGGREAFGSLALGRGWQSRSASPSFPGGTKPQSQELAPTPHLSPVTSTKVNQVLGPNIPNLTSQRAARALPSSKTRPANLYQGFWGSSQK